MRTSLLSCTLFCKIVLDCCHLTQWGRDKMAAISQMTLSIAFSWMKMFSLMFVPKGPIKNIPALVQTMAWRRPGDKPLSKPVMVNLLTHICITRHQWVKIAIQISYRRLVKLYIMIDDMAVDGKRVDAVKGDRLVEPRKWWMLWMIDGRQTP